jgi:hypothetical protein
MNKFVTFLKKKELYYTLTRYTIAAIMLRYSIMKVIGMQGVTVLPFSSWGQSLEHLSGYQLAWAFLGHSQWFQVVLGLFEFIPACMLLFRRTAFAGAILMLPMAIGVCLFNYAFDLWSSTKLFSIVLLALNILLLAFDHGRLRQIFSIAKGNLRSRHVWIETIIALLLVGSTYYVKAIRTTYHKDVNNALTGEWFSSNSYEYILLSERINDSILPHHFVRAYFDPWGQYSELNDSMNNGDGFKDYYIDEAKRSLSISYFPYLTARTPPHYYYLGGEFSFDLKNDTLLLQQTINDSTDHYWAFKRRVLDVTKHN